MDSAPLDYRSIYFSFFLPPFLRPLFSDHSRSFSPFVFVSLVTAFSHTGLTDMDINPHTWACPDFASAPFQEQRERLMASSGVNEEAVIQVLQESWQTSHDTLCAAWDLNQANPPPPPPPPCPSVPPADPHEDGHRNDERPVPRHPSCKLTVNVDPLPAPITLCPEPLAGRLLRKRHARYADVQLGKHNWVNLHYFSVEGCNAAAAQGDHIAPSSELRLEHRGTNSIALLSAPSAVPLKNVVLDWLMSLAAMRDASYCFLEAIDQHGWGTEVVEMFNRFFVNVDTHPLKDEEGGVQVLQL